MLWLANQSALVLHMWSSRVPHLTEPDWVVFNLDPGDGSWTELVTIATSLREMLEELGLESVPKTTGKRGLHVLVPLARGHTPEDALDFALALTRTLERRHPKLATTERTIRARKGRLYLDAFQNGVGKTIVAPYSLRPVDGAPVSTPLRWDGSPSRFDPGLQPAHPARAARPGGRLVRARARREPATSPIARVTPFRFHARTRATDPGCELAHLDRSSLARHLPPQSPRPRATRSWPSTPSPSW